MLDNYQQLIQTEHCYSTKTFAPVVFLQLANKGIILIIVYSVANGLRTHRDCNV